MVIAVPTWIGLGLLLCWVPALIASRKGEPILWWVLFGIVALPLAVVFALAEKPTAER